MTFSNKLNFGKYKGKTIEYIYKHDAQYLAWCLDNTKFLLLSAEDRIKIYKKAQKEAILAFKWDYS